MKLLSALAQYNLVQSRIDSLEKSGESRAADRTFLSRQARSLRDQILRNAPQSRDEAAGKLSCILNLMRRDPSLQGVDCDFSDMLEAAADTCNEYLLEDPGPRATGTPSGENPSGQAVFGGTIADYVAFSEGRVSLIDTNFTYIATSEENARFYGRQQIGIMGRHVSELIGQFRFETRAKPRLDDCFAGRTQTYHHALNRQGDALILRCDMKPVNSSEGLILGALVYITDVTEQVRKLRPSSDTLIRGISARN